MIRKTLIALVFTVPAAAFAASHDGKVSAEVQDQILTMLAGMQCQMDADNIETDDTGYELDDVFCADGQYDIDLDANLKVTNKRKE
ncbi:PepSY domain-containing protein [Puniceibacterium sediminis]|uniref:Peptidase propeptide and YPEB domain-containing protein n=1 Tax=Puniceibacterium sediminis TaxID=1608407 RepID=A0A238XZN6_9RHOB|nr:PepSY domain-containing protein [Puniceibacterium sediminis]SNR63509.1 Peptidase propeptide and YPEB domain-containing protein [Puniceibacterium sediminis]